MLCEIGTELGFFPLWMSMTALGLLSMLILSGVIFYYYYVTPTYEMWQYKSNPKFPSPLLVKKEIIHMCKGLIVAALCPAFTLAISSSGYSHGYCGSTTNVKAMPLYAQAILVFFFTDLYEYVYHAIGHSFSFFWEVHRHHHRFYNPSPFAVIADEYLDQFVRTWPMVILPLLTPINMDLMFGIFTTLFYGYGVYLHWGYESPVLSAHNPIFNTAYHHYMHHS
jgi:lathosterol oxidase